MSEMGYGMMFGSDVQKDFFLKRIKGRGYVDVGTSVISEFYTLDNRQTSAGDVRSGSRRCGLIWCGQHNYLTGGTNRQETVKTLENPLVTRDLQNFSVCQMGFKS